MYNKYDVTYCHNWNVNIFVYIRVALIDKKSDIKQLKKDVVGWLKLISLIMKDKIKQSILKFLNEEGKNLNFLGMYPPDKCSLILSDNYVIIFEGSSHYYLLNQMELFLMKQKT